MPSSREPINQQPDRGVDIALAEFNALRAEIVGHLTAQYALVGVALTAFGVIITLAFSKGGDSQLLLVVPPLAAIVSLLYSGVTCQMLQIGRYVRLTLWPFLQKHAERVPSWEEYQEVHRHTDHQFLRALLIDFVPTLIFLGASLAASFLLAIPAKGIKDVAGELQGLAWLCTLVTLVAPLLFFLVSPGFFAYRSNGQTR